jgi:hypothetical protein
VSTLRAILVALLVAALVLGSGTAEASRCGTAASADGGTMSSSPITALPITLSCWARITNGTVNHGFLVSGNSGGGGTNDYFSIQCLSDEIVFARASNATTATDASQSGTTSLNVWHHFAAVFASTTSRTMYVDGVAGATDTDSDSTTFANVNRVVIGNGLAATTIGLHHEVAEATIFNVALSAGEIATLAAGFHPRAVRPTAVIFYDACDGMATTGRDEYSGSSLTPTSMELRDHPPFLRGGRR